eukprot:4873059-Lingulodinium_polyedra.AAC.1
MAFARRARQRAACEVKTQATPRVSSLSFAGGEQGRQVATGNVRTIESQVEDRLRAEVTPRRVLVGWIVKRAV